MSSVFRLFECRLHGWGGNLIIIRQDNAVHEFKKFFFQFETELICSEKFKLGCMTKFFIFIFKNNERAKKVCYPINLIRVGWGKVGHSKFLFVCQK